MIASGGFFTSRLKVLAELSTHHSMPAVYWSREYVAVGGLLTKPAKPPPMAGENRKFYSFGNEVMKSPWGTAKNPQGDQ